MKPKVGNVAVCLLNLLVGCAAHIDSRVTTFHQLTPGSPKSFIVVPYPNQEASAEWRLYAGDVTRRLEGKGWKSVSDSQSPEVAVFLSYGVKRIDRIETGVLVGETGYSAARTTGVATTQGAATNVNALTRYTPTYGPVGSTQYTVTSHVRGVELVAMDYQAWVRDKRLVPLFEGRVESEGSTKEINVVMPYLLNALFADFPGRPGETRNVRQEFNR